MSAITETSFNQLSVSNKLFKQICVEKIFMYNIEFKLFFK